MNAKKKKLVTFNITEELKRKIEVAAEEKETSQNTIVRIALKEYFKYNS